MISYIRAQVPVEALSIHLESEPTATINCQTQGGTQPYAVIHLGSDIAVFPSDAQVLKLEAALKEYIDSRALVAESAATGAQAAFEATEHAAATAGDTEPF